MAGEALNITLLDASWPLPDLLRAPTVCQIPRGAEMDKLAWPLSWKEDAATMTSGKITLQHCAQERNTVTLDPGKIAALISREGEQLKGGFVCPSAESTEE